MSDYRSNYGGFNPMNPFAMFTEQWMMAMRAWTQAWASMMPGMSGQWQQGPWTPMAYGAPAPKLSVQVISTRPAEVSAVLNPGLEPCGLVCDPLRGEGTTPGQIDAPAIHMEPGCVRIAVHVKHDQGTGRYRGSIRKKTDGSVAGEVSVSLT